MDTFLEGPFMVVEEDNYFTLPDKNKTSQWIVDKHHITPATSLVIQSKLTPGIYQVDANRDQGIFCKKLKITSDKLYTFSNSIIEDLIKEIKLFWKKDDIFKKNNLLHKRGILLEGYPGTGKSSIISLLSNEIIIDKGIVFVVTGPNNFNIYVEFITNYFRRIEPDTPVITILEDIDTYTDTTNILDFLDGKTSINHHVIITTTNDTTKLPDSFLRPSRLDLKIEIPMPNEIIRKEFFEFKGVPKNDIDFLAKETENCSLADLKEIYTTIYVLDYSLSEAIEKVKMPRTRKNYNFGKGKKSDISI